MMSGTSPATRDDLQRLEQSLLKVMDERFDRVHEDINRVLDVLINVDKRLQGKLENHESRLVRLEKTVAA